MSLDVKSLSLCGMDDGLDSGVKRVKACQGVSCSHCNWDFNIHIYECIKVF